METVIEPLVPEPEPTAAPEQDTDALVALLVDQLNVEVLPVVTEDGENDAPVTDGAAGATALNVAVPSVSPAALIAATLQEPEPVPITDTEMLPDAALPR